MRRLSIVVVIAVLFSGGCASILGSARRDLNSPNAKRVRTFLGIAKAITRRRS